MSAGDGRERRRFGVGTHFAKFVSKFAMSKREAKFDRNTSKYDRGTAAASGYLSVPGGGYLDFA